MSSLPVRITLVRHGESAANLARRWQGQGDSPLSDAGRTQAALLGRRLVGTEFSRVVSSDLSRAVDTARAVGLPFSQERQFREFDVGVWEGLTHEEVETRFPEEMARLKNGEDVPFGGGESFRSFSERIDAAFDDLRNSLAPGEHALLVCHGGVIGTVLSRAMQLRGKRRFPLARLTNTSLSELVFDGGDVGLRVFNDTQHLVALPTWPQYAEASALVALIAHGPALAESGVFAARYDVATDFPSPSSDAELGLAPGLADAVRALQERHPEDRVALRAGADDIHGFVRSTLWPDASEAMATLHPLRTGGVAHVGRTLGKLTLLDYGAFVP